MLKRVGRTMATIAALSALVMVSQAGAVDKLVVNNSGGSPVFKVDDAGQVGTATKLGIGTLSPLSTLTIVDQAGASTRGIGAYQTSPDGFAGVVDFRKSRGTYASPSTVIDGDFVGAFHGRAWDGAAWRTGATINYFVDAAPGVGNGGVPMALLLSTGSNDDGLALPKTPRMRIGSDGKISIGNGNSAAVISGNGIMDVNADTFRLRQTRTPSSSTSACNQGEISWDANYIYVCIATNTWRRTALSSW